MFAGRAVDVLHHRRERGGFAGTGGAGNKDDASRRLGDTLDTRKEAQLFEWRDVSLHIPHGEAKSAALLENIGSKAADARDEVGEVDLAVFLKLRATMPGDDLLDDLVDPLFGGERALDGDKLAADSE